jgi:hypothetical protein
MEVIGMGFSGTVWISSLRIAGSFDDGKDSEFP